MDKSLDREDTSNPSELFKFKQLVEREGKAARNVVSWTLAAADKKREGRGRGSKNGNRREKRQPSHRRTSAGGSTRNSSSRQDLPPTTLVRKSHEKHGRLKGNKERGEKADEESRDKFSEQKAAASPDNLALSEVVCVAAAGEYSDAQRRSCLPGKRRDQQARYWSYLFDNLHRVVDEIYCTCEADESIIECQEVLMTLDVCRSDFEALIARIELQREFENTSKENRPTSLSWEVRKSVSPGKLYLSSQSGAHQQSHPSLTGPTHFESNIDDITKSESSSIRSLDFNTVEHKERHGRIEQCDGRESYSATATDSKGTAGTNGRGGSVGSWADRVKGVSYQHTSPSVCLSPQCGLRAGQEQHTSTAQLLPGTTASGEGGGEGSGDSSKVHVDDDGDWEKVTRHRPRNNSHVGRNEVTNVTQSSSSSSPLPDRHTKEADNTTQVKPSLVSSLCVERARSPVSIGQQETMKPEQDQVEKTRSEEGCVSITAEGTSTSDEDLKSKVWISIMQEHESREREDSQCWADRSDSPPLLFLPEGRSPGRGVQIHQKLSSPLRKRAGEDFIRELEEKQAKAQELRDRLQEEKAQRSRTMFEKVKEVNKNRNARTQQRKEMMEGRLERAQQLRVSFLQEVVRKAQEEDTKVNEIAFINSLEAQNKKMEVLERHMGAEARLHDIQEERQRKKEENQAKEEAASERRRSKEAERVAKLQEKRREQEAKREQIISERDKAREEAVRERARERERKLEARNAALISSMEELEKKIQLKRDESSRRYGQQLEHRKEKAAVISRHSSTDYAPAVEAYKRKKWCSVCHVKIVSEVYLMSHLRGRKHCEALQSAGLPEQPDPMAVIVHAPDEADESSPVVAEIQARLKSGKKRAKKLKQRMNARVAEFESMLRTEKPTTSSRHQHRLPRLVKDLSRQVDAVKSSSARDYSQIERTLGEINRILASKSSDDQSLFSQLGGLTSLSQFLLLYLEPTSSSLSNDRAFMLAMSVIEAACHGHVNNCRYFLLANKMSIVIDLAAQNMNLHQPASAGKGTMGSVSERLSCSPKSKEQHCIPHANVCGPLFTLMGVIIGVVTQSSIDPITDQAIKDCISYLVCTGVFDKVSECFKSITGPFDDVATSLLIIGCLNLLVVTSAALHSGIVDVFSVNPTDPTQLVCVLSHTELAGILPLLYALLLHDGPPRHSTIPPVLPSHLLSIATAGVKAINNMAILALKVVQTCLGAEGISLEFRHVVSYLLWYCSHHEAEQLRHELILAVGYFSVLNPDNQLFLLSGRNRTLLQSLCQLPFNYFTDPALSKLLYPTLMAACYGVVESKEVLEQEVSCALLCSYLEEQIGCDENTAVEDKDKSAKKITPDWISQEYRFPKSHWKRALDFFTGIPKQ